MKECESALLKAVGFQAAVSSDSGCAIRSFADSCCRSGRLDAEYYNSLKALLAHMIEAGLSSKERQEGIYFAESLDEIKRILRLA